MPSEPGHVPMDALWQYHTKKTPLTKGQLAHAIDCKQCVYILSVCMICPTLADFRAIAEKVYSRGQTCVDKGIELRGL